MDLIEAWRRIWSAAAAAMIGCALRASIDAHSPYLLPPAIKAVPIERAADERTMPNEAQFRIVLTTGVWAERGETTGSVRGAAPVRGSGLRSRNRAARLSWPIEPKPG
jgi:hypothetical protein